MSISEEFEKFKEDQIQYESATSNVASLMSVYDTMEFQKKQTASDRALNVAKAFYNGAVSQTIGGALRGLQWIRDMNEAQLNAENPDRMPMDEGARKLLDDAADAEFLQPYNVRADSSAERFAYDIVQGAGQLGGQVAVGYLTGGYGVIPSMALQIGGTEYKELRDKGVDVQTAGDAALFNAAVQTPLEYIGFSKITKAIPGNTMLKQRVMKLAENAFTEGVTEFLQEYPEQASAIWAAQSSGSSPKSTDVVAKEIAQTAWDNLGKIAPDAAYSGLIGGILGGGAGGLHLALDRDINHAMQREVHSALVEEEEHRIEEIKRSGINPPYAAAVINDNMQGQSVYVDGETLQGYAQEKGADKVAESLGVTVEDIEKAAANGDTVDIKLGNFEATGAAFDGFFDAVKESTAFEDGGYTPQKDRVEQELAKKAKAQEEAIHSESERITDELIRAGVNKEQASNALAVITARAMNTDDPAAFLKKLSYKFGGEGTRVQLAQTSNPVKGITEKPSSTNGGKSTFFTLESDVMDVSGHIPENGTPFIDNLWYKEKYAKDPTDASTVSPEVKGKGIAKNHVLSAIGYFKGKGFDSFKIKIMSPDSNALMKRLEQEGYVKALNEWQEGGDVEYSILKEKQDYGHAGNQDIGIEDTKQGDDDFGISSERKETLFNIVAGHIDNYIAKEIEKGTPREEVLTELLSENSAHRAGLFGRVRTLVLDLKNHKKESDEYKRKRISDLKPGIVVGEENVDAKYQELTDFLQELIDYGGLLYREIAIDRNRHEGFGLRVVSWADAENQRNERLRKAREEKLNTKQAQSHSDNQGGFPYAQFAGENAKTADALKLSEAKSMETEGASAEDIYKKTGWLKGKDGKWRFEIPDNLDKIDFSALEDEEAAYLKDIYDNPALYKAYPELAYVSVQVGNALEGWSEDTQGMATEGVIFLRRESLYNGKAKTTLIHELQHVIQKREGFAAGGNPRTVKEKIRKEIQKISQKLEMPGNDAARWEALQKKVEAIDDSDVEAWLGVLQELNDFEKTLPPEKAKQISSLYFARKELNEALQSFDEEGLYHNLGGEQEAEEAAFIAASKADAAREVENGETRLGEAENRLSDAIKSLPEDQQQEVKGFIESRDYDNNDEMAAFDNYPDAVLDAMTDVMSAYDELQKALANKEKVSERMPSPHNANAIIVFNGNEMPYSESYAQELKGGFDPNTNIITLFKGADASTVIHETWHFFIEQMWQSVQDGTASEQTVKDFNSLLEYAGMTQDEWAKADVEGRRKAHERLAEAGETYIMEGNAPSLELKHVFAKFAKWLKEVYRSLQRNENATELTDEVREVFDRMLAAEEDIARMERVNGYFAKLPEVLTENMSDATRKRVEKYIEKARDKAVDILTKRALRNYTKQRREEIKKFKEEIRPSVEAEVGRRREYACGYTRKDAERYKKLQRQSSEVGVWNDDDRAFLLAASLKAETYGFSSADEMMKAVEAAPKKSEAVEARLKERVEELSSEEEPENYARTVQEALYNEDEALLIGVEQQLIEDYARKAKGQQIERAQTATITADIAAARRQQAKTAAKADLANMNVKNATRTSKFITAERRAAVKSAELLAKKKFDEALAQKNLQAYWHAMAAESIKIQKRKQQYEKFLKRQVKLKPEAWLKDEHFAAVSQLFVRMGIAKDVHLKAAEDNLTPLADYVESMEQQFDCVDIADWLFDESIPISNTNNLTLAQYEDVVNAVKNIKAIVKAEKGVNAFNQQEAWAELKQIMMDKLSVLETRFVPNPNKPTKASALERWTASMENLDTFLEMLDNSTYGFFSTTWGNAIKHAADREYECLDKYNKADAEALKKWLPDKAAEQAANEEVYYEELGTSVTKHTLVKLLVNLGNADNAQRLCETAPVGFEHGRIWIIPEEGASKADRQACAEMTRQNLIDFLGRVLTKEDVEYAQRKIDAAEMFWGEKNDLEKRMKGFGLKKVEATPVELVIDGKPAVLRGGYFPLMRNGETGSHAAAAEVADDDPLQGKRIRTYHTNTGATKSRTQARYPVNLFPGAETQWIYESIHDLCWREVMGDFRRVMNDQDLFAMLKRKVGVARMNVFKELLEVSADPRNSKPLSEGEKMLGDAASWLRQRTSHAVIMLNLKVIMQNYANAFLYGNAVEGYTMADNIQALGTYMLKYHTPGSHKEMFDFVTSKSAFMRERCELPDITVRDIVDEKKEFIWEKVSREMGIRAMALTDNATAMPNWLQAYNKKLNEGATEQEAIDFADTIVRRVLGSSRITDVASMQRGGPIMKVLTMFQSFFNARWNEFIRTKRLSEKQWTQGQKQAAFVNMSSYVISKWLGQTLLAMALALQNPLGIDDKDKYPELLKELKSYSFTMMGPVGQVGSYILGKALGMHEFDYRMSAIESTVDKIGRAASKVSSDKATAQDKAENVIDTATMIVGLPSQINRIFWNVFDMTFNDMSPEWGDIMRRRPKKERK